MNGKKKKIRIILIILMVILVIPAGGVLFVLTHTQLIVGSIQKLSAGTVNTANVYESLGEPMEGLKDNGQYVITEIRYSDYFPNSYLDITYPDNDRDASKPTLIYFHGGGFFGGSKNFGDPPAVLLGSEYYVDMRDMDEALTKAGVVHELIDPLAERNMEMQHCFVASERVDDVSRDAFDRMIEFVKDCCE